MLSVKQGGVQYYFWVFSMTQPGINTRSPWPLANSLPTQSRGLQKHYFLKTHFTRASFTDSLKSVSFEQFLATHKLFKLFSQLLEPLGHLTEISQSLPSSQIDLVVTVCQLNWVDSRYLSICLKVYTLFKLSSLPVNNIYLFLSVMTQKSPVPRDMLNYFSVINLWQRGACCLTDQMVD